MLAPFGTRLEQASDDSPPPLVYIQNPPNETGNLQMPAIYKIPEKKDCAPPPPLPLSDRRGLVLN